jgi:hypothetical protein
MLRLPRVLLAVVAMLLPGQTFAQSREEARNAVYLELLGSGGLFSLNYEREIADGVLARAGFGSWASSSFWSDAETTVTTVPLTVALVRGRGRHRLELGGGMTVGRRTRDTFDGSSGNFVSWTGLVGYRYEKPNRGFLFRAGATPFYGFGAEDVAYPERGFFPSFGISLGYSF